MKPTIGRIVHFVQEKPASHQPKEGPRVLVNLPAIITAVWGETCVNLQVFTDGTNSDEMNMAAVKWVPLASLDASETPQPRTWHWPPMQPAASIRAQPAQPPMDGK
jgi:hypothetical protein